MTVKTAGEYKREERERHYQAGYVRVYDQWIKDGREDQFKLAVKRLVKKINKD